MFINIYVTHNLQGIICAKYQYTAFSRKIKINGRTRHLVEVPNNLFKKVKGESMSFTILETVTNEAVRTKEQLASFAADEASAGFPWLD